MSVFTDRDVAFSYTGNWFAGNFNAAAVGTSGTLHTTNDLAASVTFTFPEVAIGFEFWGIKRSHGGSYTICIDCTSSSVSGGAVPVDGFDPTDNGQQPPVQLFSHTFSTPGVHKILLSNVADSRGTPQGNSQLALASFVLTPPPKTTQAPLPPPTTSKNIPSSSTTTTTTSTSTIIPSRSSTTTGTSSTTTGTTSSNPSSTQTSTSSGISSDFSEASASFAVSSLSPAFTPSSSQSLLPASSTALPTRRDNTATTAGAAGGGAVLLLILLMLLIFYWRRQRRRGLSGIDTEVARPYFVGPDPGAASAIGNGTDIFTNGARSNQSGQTRTEGGITLPSGTTGSNYKGTAASASVTLEGSATAPSSSSAVQTPDKEMGEKGAWVELPRAAPAPGAVGVMGANEYALNESRTRDGGNTDALPRAQDAGPATFATELPPEYGAVFPSRVY